MKSTARACITDRLFTSSFPFLQAILLTNHYQSTKHIICAEIFVLRISGISLMRSTVLFYRVKARLERGVKRRWLYLKEVLAAGLRRLLSEPHAPVHYADVTQQQLACKHNAWQQHPMTGNTAQLGAGGGNY